MKGYAACYVFRAEDMRTYDLAQRVVEVLPEDGRIRCHELARIVQEVLGSGEVEDGLYGSERTHALHEHSWIVLRRLGRNRHILDPYAIGQYPPVQLVEVGLPLDDPYLAGKPRDDIRTDLVREGARLVRERLPRYHLVG